MAFRAAWTRGNGADAAISFAEFDRALHEERLAARGVMRRWRSAPADLPDGAMVAIGDRAHLVWRGGARPWSPAGYGVPAPLADDAVEVLTPPPIVAAIRAGWSPGAVGP